MANARRREEPRTRRLHSVRQRNSTAEQLSFSQRSDSPNRIFTAGA
jgi:hypothetical protein